MKKIKIYQTAVSLILILCFYAILSSQVNEMNSLDAQGNRIGRWVYYLDENLNPAPDSSYVFYKTVNYNDGKPTGYVNYYYKSGKLYFQTYVDSINPDVYADGEIKYYSEKGDIIKSLNYQNGKLNGLAEYYYPDGKPKLQGIYTDNLRTGIWKQWETNGKYGIGNYENDLPEGNWVFYFEDGSEQSEGKFHQGVRIGFWKEYMDDGSEQEGIYKDGKKEGIWIGKYSDGSQRFTGNYSNGFKNGFWKEWDDQGEHCQGNYKDNLRDGKWEFFDQNNNRIMEGIYKDGKEHGQWVRYDEKGNIFETTNRNSEPENH